MGLSTTQQWQLHGRLGELADDVGRLRRRVDPDSSLAHLAERLARHVETTLSFFEPSAAELAAWHAPGDEEAIGEAIRLVDGCHQAIRHRLGL